MLSISFTAEESSVVERAVRSRRSIQKFRPGTVDDDLVLRAVELARWGPNHRHTEPWRFYLLGNETVHQIVRLNTEMVRAAQGDAAAANKHERWLEIPHWLVLTCRRAVDPLREREDYAACCCAALNLMIVLWVNGVGMKWTTGPVTRDAEFYEIVGIPAEEEFVVGLYQYGYPEEIPHARRSPLESFVEKRP